MSKISQMFVIARNSSFTFKGKPFNVQEVSKSLGVRYVLEGSVRKAGSRVRITAQLIDGVSGHHLWAERYDRELDDIFALQDEIARAIVDALKIKLMPAERDACAIDAAGVDGFVLDLQWFGGVLSGSDNSRMGSLDWDLTHFPDPANRIAELNQKQGVGIITIEESYISRGLPEYTSLAEKNYLARACATCPPSYLISNPWWGQGGMLDWTNPAAGIFWHDWKREPLITAGVIGHWTDLGEPEMYDAASWYSGITDDYLLLNKHADVHNLFNLLWSQSIYEGYLRNGHTQRPFILSRSGAPGSQRYGAAMWSGDIGSNLISLTSQMNVQMHMSLSGMDYFGSDIGGFHRHISTSANGDSHVGLRQSGRVIDAVTDHRNQLALRL
jgi:hypothetical protein